jgi:hypothetical protein
MIGLAAAPVQPQQTRKRRLLPLSLEIAHLVPFPPPALLLERNSASSTAIRFFRLGLGRSRTNPYGKHCERYTLGGTHQPNYSLTSIKYSAHWDTWSDQYLWVPDFLGTTDGTKLVDKPFHVMYDIPGDVEPLACHVGRL